MGIWDEIKGSFRHGTALTRLMYINGAVFLVIKIIEVIGVLTASPGLAPAVISNLAVPASLSVLAFKPWTIFTYMFTHQGFIHLLFNLLWLWWFGKIFLSYLDQRKLVSIYIMGGLAGALLYIAVFNIFPAFAGAVNVSVAIGASASVMALVISTAVYLPDLELHLLFFGRVKLKYLALVTFLITSVFDFSVNTGGKIAHIGGALMGLAYGQGLKNGRDFGAWLNMIIDFFVTLFKPGRRLKVKYKKAGATFDARKMKTDHEYNAAKAERQKEIDYILDKISKGGYDSLTKEEKAILFSESQKKR
ncbi:MAG: rhomboid family intramembrane serine protease [Bacteroidales bacterium]|jgi:membrane associated rhomboid family serine protease|nr:rhomboid family intramembrane serine protease [Bacteroidales bacterium]